MELVSPAVIILLGCIALLLLLQWKNLRGPPCIGGWIPWIGAGFEFGKAPLEFIEKARIKYGPIFTIFAVGNRMTFVTEEEGIEVFLKSKKVNFELAVQNPIYRTVSIPKDTYLSLHDKLYFTMKGKMGTLNLFHLKEQLIEELHRQMENLSPHGTMDLDNLVRGEYWNYIKLHNGSQKKQRDYMYTRLSAIFEVAFWTLAFVLSHPNIHKTIMEDISSVVGTAGKDKIKVSEDDLKKLLLIKWCILEAIRLRAPGVIARKVVEPVKILNYTVPAGDLLLLSPFWLHRNPKYFPEPESFKPLRLCSHCLQIKLIVLLAQLYLPKHLEVSSSLWLALLEIQVFIILILYKYDCSLLDPLPKQSCLHLVGVQQPEGQCRIEYKQRK
ncbi:PREDICTED: 24-hydroxycholesterol 7-alpha-hydroxylase-like [Chrysochloris asiatica]|uniref:24-hydroxycholesterol 7-alpha-hydroxylase-like n=1 Tax=Chrysochloris asiatica TaxID=185453 RepID=A0A9B0WK71_CHRAS|nr:PREDICTED: 24-hydroxycholesterol 7-alpha-hydroxylase-like [Chrysochloris asiatica]